MSYGDTYISANFSNQLHWTVKMAHGKQCGVVSRQLDNAIALYHEAGFIPHLPPGLNGWSVDSNVFLVHLYRIKELVDKNHNLIFLSDQCWGIMPEADDTV
jgi:hypothetical protein